LAGGAHSAPLSRGTATETRGRVIGGRRLTASDEVVPVCAALIVIGHEMVIDIETIGPVGRLIGARPLDSRTVAKLVVTLP
jgi:hypothetical protein